MSKTEKLWRVPEDVLWAFREASKPEGMMPHAKSTALFLGLLEGRGYLQRSDHAPVWHILGPAQSVLMGEAGLTADDITAIDTLRIAVS